jgi:hypothetical protein
MSKVIKLIKREIEPETSVIYSATRDPYTFVSLSYRGHGRRFIGVGFSKRMAKDEPDPTLGYAIAHGRALTEIARDVRYIMMREAECNAG